MLSFLIKTPLLSLVLGPIVTLVGDYVHKLWPWLDRQTPMVKQAFAVVLAFVLVGVTQFIGVGVPTECADTLANGLSSACESALGSGAFLNSLVTAIVAITVKHGQKNA